MSNRVLVVLSCGTDNPNRATRAFFFAMVAHKKGKQVSVFLLDEAVYLARRGIAEQLRAATGDSADDHLQLPAGIRGPAAGLHPLRRDAPDHGGGPHPGRPHGQGRRADRPGGRQRGPELLSAWDKQTLREAT